MTRTMGFRTTFAPEPELLAIHLLRALTTASRGTRLTLDDLALALGARRSDVRHALSALHRRPRLGQCLVHEELVVHAAMLADGLRLSVTGRARPTPNRNRSTRAGSGSMTPA